MPNTVTLTFAGDTKKLDSAFDRVGRSARKMSDDVGRNVEGLDKTVGRAAALAGAGIGATMAPALAAALAGGVVLALGGGFLAAGIIGAAKDPKVAGAFQEVGKTAKSALAQFSEPFKGPLIRAAKTFSDAIKAMQPTLNEVGRALAPVIDKLAPAIAQMAQNALPGIAEAAKQSAPAFEKIAEVLPTVGTWISTFVQKMAELAAWGVRNSETIGQWLSVLVPIAGIFLGIVAAIKIWIAVQTILNIVMSLNPIGLIIIGVAALIAIIVVIATRTRWFQNIWHASWTWVKNTASSAWKWIKSSAENVWNWLKKIPGWLKTTFAKIADYLTFPFRTAFNSIARAWNNTVGQLSWTVPGWVPFFGGNSVSTPHLPTFHSGGVVPGVVGTAVPIMAQAGERVGGVASGGGGDEWLRLDMGDLGDALLHAVSKAVQRRGGQASHLGIRVVNGAVR